MADAVVSDVAKRLASAAFQVCGLLAGLEDDRSDLEQNFKQIQADLHAAEKKQPEDERVELRLKRLKSASLEAENVLDEARTEDMIQKMHGEMGRKYMLRTFFTSRYNPLMVRFRIAHKVKTIRKKLVGIGGEISASNTTSKDDAGIGGEISDRETPSLMPPEEEIIGRNENTNMIVDTICNQDIGIGRDINHVRVYAIWGMGGIGKTTLAQLVFNHETVKKHFDLKCWVYVSAVFDKRRIIKQIIKAISGSKDSELDEMSLDDLLIQLQNELEGRTYFIIMDDVWIGNEDMKKWQDLCLALRRGAKGSTVMVTTRNEYTAKLMANVPDLRHNVRVLSEEESWSLFRMLAFPGEGDQGENVKKLEDEGRQIVKKCDGLPLAVKTLGSFMLTIEKEVSDWQLVKNDLMRTMQDNNILPVLRLSYHYLLPHWKRCFSYCCLFSKGERMSKDLLIELWMANEFIPSQGDLSLYEHGEIILSCLVQRSFFRFVVAEDSYKMHDLMHDLAQYEMGDDCAFIRPGKKWSDKVLHLSLSCEDSQFSPDLKNLRSVRSVLITPDKVPILNNYTSNITQISSHVYLRVLYLNGIKSSTLPESICKLIHLRYLKISWSDIEVLPESIIYLQNLQTLILYWCLLFSELPKGLRYMRNLQRLDTRHCSLRHMPVGIKELTNLRRLSEFVVGGEDGARIGELGNLNLLGMRKLRLSKLDYVGGLSAAKSAKLNDKTNLKSLALHWFCSQDRSETFDEEVLEGLEPNSGLQELKLNNYRGRVISPSWLFNLVNLTSVEFGTLPNCEHLPQLPNLERITLWSMDSLKGLHDGDNDATSKDEILFPNLQYLYISECPSLVSLPNNFPKLGSLEIKRCDNLPSLPDKIRSFKDLNEITIYECAILSTKCKKGGEFWHKISHISHVDIVEIPRYEDHFYLARGNATIREENSDVNEDKHDDIVNYNDEDSDENENKDDSVNYRDEDSDENEVKDEDSVNYRGDD